MANIKDIKRYKVVIYFGSKGTTKTSLGITNG